MFFGFVRKWKQAVDSGQMFGALLAELFRAYLYEELLIAKLSIYDFSLPALKLVHDYL